LIHDPAYIYKIHITVIPAGIAGIQTTGMCHDANMNKQPCVYMLSSQRNGTLYIGVTSDLIKRVYQHRMGMLDGFTKRYGIHMLVWYEIHEIMESAILREKQLKKWSRIAKIRLIEQQNLTWQDLWPELASPSMASRQLLLRCSTSCIHASRGSRQSMPG
jgi:putative endonuclease